MRSRNVGEMVIHELIREYLMNFDSSTRGFTFEGNFGAKAFETASTWLKSFLLIAGGIFAWRNRDALEGLGKIIFKKIATAVAGAAAGAPPLPESRMIAENKYDSRFDTDVESDKLEEVAKQLVGMINYDIHNLPKEINATDEASINASITAFNNGAVKSMKMIVDLCTNSSRAYPGSLKAFNISGPPLPDDIKNADQQNIAGYLLLDVASIQLCSVLYENIITYYDKVKEELDKKYKSDDDMNKTLSDKIKSLLKTLSTNLYSIMSPARDILVKPK